MADTEHASLLEAVREMNNLAAEDRMRNEHASIEKEFKVLAQLVENQANVGVKQNTSLSSPAKAYRDHLINELDNIRSQNDSVHQHGAIESHFRRIEEEDRVITEKEGQAYLHAVKVIDDELHPNDIKHVIHPSGWRNTKKNPDIFDRPHTFLGDSDPSLLKKGWTRFDHHPKVAWKPSGTQISGLFSDANASNSISGNTSRRNSQVFHSRPSSGNLAHPHQYHEGEPSLTEGYPRTEEDTPRYKPLTKDPSTTARSRVDSTWFRGSAGLDIPKEALGTLTASQQRLPRHAAYLLNSRANHKQPWRRASTLSQGLFSAPPHTKPMTANEFRRIRDASVPDRVKYEPTKDGKKPFLNTSSSPYPVFSNVPLDYKWMMATSEEQENAVQERFWAQVERWDMEDKGLINPATNLPVSEHSGYYSKMASRGERLNPVESFLSRTKELAHSGAQKRHTGRQTDTIRNTENLMTDGLKRMNGTRSLSVFPITSDAYLYESAKLELRKHHPRHIQAMKYAEELKRQERAKYKKEFCRSTTQLDREMAKVGSDEILTITQYLGLED